MYVEDALDLIATRLLPKRGRLRTVHERAAELLFEEWHFSFVENVHRYASSGHSLSTEQGRILLKVIARACDLLVEQGLAQPDEIHALIASPTFRRPLYQSTSLPKEVRHIGANYLAFRFKFNEIIVQDLRLLQHCDTAKATFDRDHRLWIVSVVRDDFDAVRRIIGRHRFRMDEATTEWLRLAEECIGQPSLLTVEQDAGLILATVRDNELLASWMQHVAGAEHV